MSVSFHVILMNQINFALGSLFLCVSLCMFLFGGLWLVDLDGSLRLITMYSNEIFITEMKSVYCAVRTGSLNKAVGASSLKG